MSWNLIFFVTWYSCTKCYMPKLWIKMFICADPCGAGISPWSARMAANFIHQGAVQLSVSWTWTRSQTQHSQYNTQYCRWRQFVISMLIFFGLLGFLCTLSNFSDFLKLLFALHTNIVKQAFFCSLLPFPARLLNPFQSSHYETFLQPWRKGF